MGPNTVVSTRPRSWGLCQWFATIGGLGRRRLRVLVPRPVGLGGEVPASGSMIDEKQRPEPRLSYHASGTPPQLRRKITRQFEGCMTNVLFYPPTSSMSAHDGDCFRIQRRSIIEKHCPKKSNLNLTFSAVLAKRGNLNLDLKSQSSYRQI